jgi:ABC-type phosphate transport system substrate-binding protein
MDQATVSRIFLGKAKSFPNGSQALPVDQDEGSKTREAFNTSILGKSDSQLKSYWSRLIFTGKGTPPKQSGTVAEIKTLVADNPNIIGYIDSSAVDATVKVVHRF